MVHFCMLICKLAAIKAKVLVLVNALSILEFYCSRKTPWAEAGLRSFALHSCLTCLCTGGNCNTALVANIFGEAAQIEETVSKILLGDGREQWNSCCVLSNLLQLCSLCFAALHSPLCSKDEVCAHRASCQQARRPCCKIQNLQGTWKVLSKKK